MKVSVIIVSYNARYFLEQCLHSVERALEDIEGEIIVVDNNSPEQPVKFIKDKFPRVNFIESPKNLGFGKANNLGVSKAKGEYVLILNPDTLVPEDLFGEILPFADSTPKMGALGVRLMDADGRFHPECKRNIPNFKNTFGKLFGSAFNKNSSGGYYKSEVDEFETAEAEILQGAFMLLRKSVYEEVGGFDERYFMYGEDIDLSYTLLLNGYTNYYKGGVTVLHYKGESTRKDKKYLKIFFGAMNIFIDKYYKKDFLTYPIYKLGLKLRYLWAVIRGGFKSEDRKEREEINIEELKAVKVSSEINEDVNKVLLKGTALNNKEMLDLITEHSGQGRAFFIHPAQMDVLIGGSGIVQFD